MRRAEERVALAWRRASLADGGVEAGQGVRALWGLPCVYKYPCTGVFWFEPSGIRKSQHTSRSAAGAFVVMSHVFL